MPDGHAFASYPADHPGRPSAIVDPRSDAARWLRRADRHHTSGNLPEALASYLEAVRLQPDLCAAYYNAGLIYQQMGRPGESSACYRKALELNPGLASARNNLGRLHLDAGRADAALDCFMETIRRQPDFAEAHFNLGELLRARRRPKEAIVALQTALRLNPSLFGAWNNLGNLLRDGGHPEGAAECFREMVRLRPDMYEGHYNLGSTLKDIGDPQAAVAHLETALRLNPGHAEGWNNLGLAHKNRGDWDGALACFNASLKIECDLAAAHWNRSSVFLLTGRFAEGWEDYEWRFRLPNWRTLYPFRKSTPLWDGTPGSRLRLLVHDEQGLGDTLQFVRYLPALRKCCGHVTLETRRELLPLFRGLAGADEIVARPERVDDPGAAADAHIPLLSLPRVFRTTADSIPAAVPYVAADARTSAAWSHRVHGPGMKVGLVWAGRPEHQNDRNRSCGLDAFRPLAAVPGLKLFSLQKGPAESQLHACDLKTAVDHLGPELADFADTAAAIAHLDLLVCVDTSVAHLAGAMGRPVWVLLPTIPDWRWMLDREDSPWYPTMRLFRRPAGQGWDAVVARVVSELGKAGRERLAGFHAQSPR